LTGAAEGRDVSDGLVVGTPEGATDTVGCTEGAFGAIKGKLRKVKLEQSLSL